MEFPEVFYSKSDYVETASENKVSRQSNLCQAKNIVLGGKTILMHKTTLRADLANIKIGGYTIVKENVVLRPAFKKFTRGSNFYPLTIGDHTLIEENSVIMAQQIGSYVHIGKNCVIDKRASLKDCCAVLDNSYVPPDTVIAPYSCFSGNPARFTFELPEVTLELMVDSTVSFFDRFKGIADTRDRRT